LKKWINDLILNSPSLSFDTQLLHTLYEKYKHKGSTLVSEVQRLYKVVHEKETGKQMKSLGNAIATQWKK
jgi:hypothetical protein